VINFEPPYITAITFCILVFIACSSFSSIIRCFIKKDDENFLPSTIVLFTSVLGIISMLLLMQQAQIYLDWAKDM